MNITNYIFLMLFILIYSCNNSKLEKSNYPKSDTISNIDDQRRDSLTCYFPTIIHRDTLDIETNIGTDDQKLFSNVLMLANEPVLSNYYLNKSIYRFLLIRSFDKPIIISISKENEHVVLEIKRFNFLPRLIDNKPVRTNPPKVKYVNGSESTYLDTVAEQANVNEMDSLITTKTKILNLKDWQYFEGILGNCLFWNASPIDGGGGLDGSYWTIEGHLQNKYWFVSRFSPKGCFREAGEYLIFLSEVEEQIY